jgi:hypothetical protein
MLGVREGRGPTPRGQDGAGEREVCRPGSNKPPLGAKYAAPGPSRPLPAVPTQERRPPSPPCTAETEVGGVEVSMDISVEDYLVSGVAIFDAHTGRGPVGEGFFKTGSGCLT